MKTSFIQILNYINESNKIFIFNHARPDFDAFGSAYALYLSLTEKYKQKKIYFVGESNKLFNQYKNPDQVNREMNFEKSLAIVVDTANSERISSSLFSLIPVSIKIDHHPDMEDFTTVSYVDTTASSASEIVTDFIKKTKLPLNPEMAKFLYYGIITDTNRFLFSNTTYKTHEIVSELLKCDFDSYMAKEELYNRHSDQLKFVAFLYNNFIFEDGIGYIHIKTSELSNYKLKVGDVSKYINDFNFLEDVEAWVFFIEDEKKFIRCSLRSKSIPIDIVAMKFSGGGHPKASGAKLNSADDIPKLLEELKKTIKEY